MNSIKILVDSSKSAKEDSEKSLRSLVLKMFILNFEFMEEGQE